MKPGSFGAAGHQLRGKVSKILSSDWFRSIDITRVAILVFSAWIAWLVAHSALNLGLFGIILYNADALYIAGFFTDLVAHAGSISGWRFAPSPSLFPDVPIYAAATLAGRDFRSAIIVCAGLQTALFLEGGRTLAAIAGLRARGVLVGTLMAVIAICFVQYFFVPLPKNFGVFWLSPLVLLSCHFGAILCSIWGLILIATALQSSSFSGASIRIFGLGVLILVTGWSDLLYLIWFCFPALCVLACSMVFAKQWRRRAAVIGLLIVVLSLLVYWLQVRFNPVLERYHDDGPWEPAAGRSILFFLHYLFGTGWVLAVHASIVCILAFALMSQSAARLLSAMRGGEVSSAGRVRILIVSYLSASSLACLGSGIVLGLFQTEALPRYSLPVVYMSILGLGFVMAERCEDREIRLLAWMKPALLACVVPVFCLLLATRTYAGLLRSPPEMECLPTDRNLAGLAEYWLARPLTLFSGERLQVEPLAETSKPYWWISNRRWFTHSLAQPAKMPLYSFIATRRILDLAALEAYYGKPSRIVPCGEGDIWFYDDAEELTRRFRVVYDTTDAARQ